MPLQSDPLQGLRDIHLPPAISWWPPAVGWWIVLAIIIIIALVALWFFKFRPKPKVPHKAALSLISQLYEQYKQQPDKELVSQLANVLRRYAIFKYGREKIASLQGEQWLKFLDETSQSHDFSKGVGSVLIKAPYAKELNEDVALVFPLVARWVRAQNQGGSKNV